MIDALQVPKLHNMSAHSEALKCQMNQVPSSLNVKVVFSILGHSIVGILLCRLALMLY